MFTNDMFMILDGDVEVYNYADDNSLISAGFNAKSTQQNLIRNVNKVMDWFEQNNMKVNPDKFSYIVLLWFWITGCCCHKMAKGGKLEPWNWDVLVYVL